MDYLVIEGFKSAAEEFSREAGLTAPVDLESIESRMNIREALQRGDVTEAITRVNDLNPEVSVYDPTFGIVLVEGNRIKKFHAPLSDRFAVSDDTYTKTSAFRMQRHRCELNQNTPSGTRLVHLTCSRPSRGA